MDIEYKYSMLLIPLSYTEHSPAMQVTEQPEYNKSEFPINSIYPLTPCIP